MFLSPIVLLANEAFQNRVLAELRDISQVFSDDPGLVRETEQELAAAGVDVSPDALQLAPTEVVGKPGTYRPEQVILGRVSAVNAYIEDNPEKAEAVGFVMAAAQGPKGLIMWAAERALSETPFGEKVAQYQAYLQGVLGKAVAEGVEQRDNMDEQDGEDAYLIGGGSLIATLLVGAAGSKTVKVIKTKENTSPSANQNPHAGHADNESGLNKGAVRHDAEPTVHEKKIADEIAADGQDVILRGANTPGPDAIINGKYWEIKEITGNGGRTLQNNIRDARSQFGNEGSIALGLNPSEARVLIDARGSKVWNDPANVRSEIAELASTGGLRDVAELKVVTSAGVVTWRP
ncbi:hypothetical protein HNQ27_02755 [Pseudomonas sp. B11D7D]|nr:hypothetical protein HNQ27_02755 [Pseudomonas sp. B11D7D]